MNSIVVSGDSWSDLPNDVLTIISDRLNTRIDNLRLRAVCSSWRSTIPIYNNNTNSLRLPMELPYPGECSYAGVSPTSTLVETIMYRFEPLDQDKFDSNCVGGWLIKAQEVRPNEFSLLSYDASKISFPRNLNVLDYSVFELGKFYGLIKCSTPEKTIFSSEHNSLLALLDGELTFFRFGDEKWTKLDDHPKYKDIIMYKSEFHAIDKFGNLVSFNASNLNITRFSHPLYTTPVWECGRGDGYGQWVSRQCSPGGIYHCGLKANSMYLMQGFGELYFVVGPSNIYGGEMYYDMELNQIIYNDGRYIKTMHDIQIYKLKEENKYWVKVKSLGDKVIILSVNDSLIVSAEELAGFRGNCIYFADQKSFLQIFANLLSCNGFVFPKDDGIF